MKLILTEPEVRSILVDVYNKVPMGPLVGMPDEVDVKYVYMDSELVRVEIAPTQKA